MLLEGEACGICLADFMVGDTLKSAAATTDRCRGHLFHAACLHEW
jgi:hypothetical protein